MVSDVKLKFQVDTKEAKQALKNGIDSLLKEVQKDFLSKYYSSLKLKLLSNSVHSYFFSKTLQAVAAMQSEYFGDGMIAQDDPTAFLHGEYVRAIEQEIIQNFTLAASTVSPNSELDLILLSDEFLGFGKEGDMRGTAPIQWMVYFLVGALETDLYWVDADTYELFTGESPQGQLGRFGIGHLWHIQSDDAKVRLNAKLSTVGKNLEQLKHPQSGKAGKNWFADILTEAEINNLIIQPAIVESTEFIQAKYANYRV